MYIYVYVCLNNQVACTKYKNLHKFERKCKLLYESVGGREIVFFQTWKNCIFIFCTLLHYKMTSPTKYCYKKIKWCQKFWDSKELKEKVLFKKERMETMAKSQHGSTVFESFHITFNVCKICIVSDFKHPLIIRLKHTSFRIFCLKMGNKKLLEWQCWHVLPG